MATVPSALPSHLQFARPAAFQSSDDSKSTLPSTTTSSSPSTASPPTRPPSHTVISPGAFGASRSAPILRPLTTVQISRKFHLYDKYSAIRQRVASVARAGMPDLDDFFTIAEEEEELDNPYETATRLPISPSSPSHSSSDSPTLHDDSSSADGTIAVQLSFFERWRRYQIISGPTLLWNIMVNEGCERFSYYAMRTILDSFLGSGPKGDGVGGLGWTDNQAHQGYSAFNALGYTFPMLGGWASDTYLGKYWTVILFSLIYVCGSSLLATSANFLSTPMAICALILICVGTGGIKPCVASFGADQFANPLLPPRSPAQKLREISSFFAAFYVVINMGSIFSSSLIPYVRSFFSTSVAFAIPAVLIFIATGAFAYPYKSYYIKKPAGSLLPPIIKILYVGIKLQVQKYVFFMNIPPPTLAPDSPPSTPLHWLDSTRTLPFIDPLQIPNAKAIARVWRVFFFFIIFWSMHDQEGSVWVTQAKTLDLGWLQPETLGCINPIEIVIFLPILSGVIYPWIGPKFTPIKRMIVGMLFCIASFLSSYILQLYIDSSPAKSLSIWWQLPQITLMVFSELLVSVTGLEYAYTQSPKDLKAIVASQFYLTTAFGNVFTIIVLGLKDLLSPSNLIMVFIGFMVANTVVFWWTTREMDREGSQGERPNENKVAIVTITGEEKKRDENNNHDSNNSDNLSTSLPGNGNEMVIVGPPQLSFQSANEIEMQTNTNTKDSDRQNINDNPNGDSDM